MPKRKREGEATTQDPRQANSFAPCDVVPMSKTRRNADSRKSIFSWMVPPPDDPPIGSVYAPWMMSTLYEILQCLSEGKTSKLGIRAKRRRHIGVWQKDVTLRLDPR
ncbi:hypothetical protein ABVK25_001650 [Lepraria finkii]|uniref:Uncharacterized protein n=1 Tax=Lepraria finkii TaxID=1340010 RepID=A0ABR4BJM7_9LECA